MAISKSKRFEIFKRDGFTCQYCGQRPPDVVLEVDHIHPQSKGGTDEDVNLITSCYDCNRGKSAKLLEQPITPIVLDPTEQYYALQQQLAEVQLFLQIKQEQDEAWNRFVDELNEAWQSIFKNGNPLPSDDWRQLLLYNKPVDVIRAAAFVADDYFRGRAAYASNKTLLQQVRRALRKYAKERRGQ